MVGLLAAWPATPALVLGRALDVLASNPLAEELFGGFPATRNLVEFVFLTPAARTLYPDWNVVARNTVAAFRLADGAHPGDPRIRSVREALRGSEEFSRWWDRHDARGKTAERKRFAHPRAGEFTLDVQTFDVRDGAGQQLAVYHAAAGTPSADALTLLGMLAAQRTARTTAQTTAQVTSTNTGLV
nr:hypothetical protein [Kineococcus aurantiacus]